CVVALAEGAVLAPLASPDMRPPIAFALAWPARMTTPVPRLDLVKLQSLTFEAPDEDRFLALRLARDVLKQGGAAPAVLNAANEIAVEAFLNRRIGFLDIAGTVAQCLERAEAKSLLKRAHSLDDVLAVDREARLMTRPLIAGL